MKLSILIPTYNRSKFLIKNLVLLYNYILKANLLDEIEIIVSNNCSPDDTDERVNEFVKSNPNLNLRYFLQKENIGLEKNALFVLKQAKGEYVMYLGDDDYIEYDYLIYIISHIQNNKETKVIIPSYIPLSIEGEQVGVARDVNLPNKIFKSGFKNCLINSWRGHQLSGLVLKSENLYKSYKDRNVGNIYLFIYFVAYSCLMGDTYHLTTYPIRVTQPGQKNKDWNYGKDGLLTEVFDNYKKLPINWLKKGILQLYFFRKQPWRLWNFKSVSNNNFFKAFFNIWFSKNSTFIFKLVFPFLILSQIVYKQVKKVNS